jgi:hypothetical protein
MIMITTGNSSLWLWLWKRLSQVQWQKQSVHCSKWVFLPGCDGHCDCGLWERDCQFFRVTVTVTVSLSLLLKSCSLSEIVLQVLPIGSPTYQWHSQADSDQIRTQAGRQPWPAQPGRLSGLAWPDQNWFLLEQQLASWWPIALQVLPVEMPTYHWLSAAQQGPIRIDSVLDCSSPCGGQIFSKIWPKY